MTTSLAPATLPPGPPPVTYHPLSILRYARTMRRDAPGIVGGRFERFGDLYFASFLGRPMYVLRDAELARQVLITEAASFQKPETGITFRQLRQLLGEGLLTSNGDFWRQQRRVIQPAFKPAHLEHYADVVVAHTQRALAEIRANEPVDISAAMMNLTLRIVSKALFDHDISDEGDRVARTMTVFRESFGGLSALLPDWLPIPAKRRSREALADIDELVYGLLDARRGRGGNDLLSVLANTPVDDSGSEAMTRKQLRDELLTLFIAGHETTSHALSWTFYLLSRHPEVEARLHAEVDAAFSRHATVSYAQLSELPYSEWVVNEAMRLFPPAFAISRVASEDVQLGDYQVPAGAEVLIWIYHVHRHPDYFPDPERFDPERFSPERSAALPSCAFIPFGAGARTCIGKHFAMMEARLILAHIANSYRVQVDPHYRLSRSFSVTLAPSGGLPARFAPRTLQP